MDKVKWRPIPEHLPAPGFYWATRKWRPETIEILYGHVWVLGQTGSFGWPDVVKIFTHIAGPIEPPESEDG